MRRSFERRTLRPSWLHAPLSVARTQLTACVLYLGGVPQGRAQFRLERMGPGARSCTSAQGTMLRGSVLGWGALVR